MHKLQSRGLSQRRSCALCGISRSSFAYRPCAERLQRDKELGQQLHRIARHRPRFGYRRAHDALRRKGQFINQKRVRRLWKEQGLTLPQRRSRKRRRRPEIALPCAATHPHQVWTYDFVQDRCNQGHKLRFLTVTDEFTRKNLAIVTATSIRSQRVLQELECLFEQHGTPQYLRSDNGPEFVAQAVQQWLKQEKVQTLYIEPGCPWQNGYAESFHSRFRDECLNCEWFHNVREARVLVEAWRLYYNQERPHSSLGYLTPLEFEARWEKEQRKEQHNEWLHATDSTTGF